LQDSFKTLLDNYKRLLHEFSKITKISDINQKKLFDSYNEVEQQKVILYKAATTDQLTNIYNRAFLMESLDTEFERSKRFNQEYSCILFDIDDFKNINDTYGHQMGDVVINNVAAVAAGLIRSTDIFGRYGGEEFLIIMPNTSIDGATVISEKIRKKIACTDFSYHKNRITCTISLGLSDSEMGHPVSSDDMLYNVDSALYKAKSAGKNVSIVYCDESEK